MVAETKDNNFKILMQSKGLTIESISKELGISISTIKRLSAGAATDVRLSSVLPIAEYFHVSIDEVMGLRPLRKNSHFDISTELSVRVPTLHWEQLCPEMDKVVTKLDLYSWDFWTDINMPANENTFALSITQKSLPAPFYKNSVIVIDPDHPISDSNYIINMSTLTENKHNFEIVQYLVNGNKVYYKNIQSKEIYLQHENDQPIGPIIFCKANLVEGEFN